MTKLIPLNGEYHKMLDNAYCSIVSVVRENNGEIMFGDDDRICVSRHHLMGDVLISDRVDGIKLNTEDELMIHLADRDAWVTDTYDEYPFGEDLIELHDAVALYLSTNDKKDENDCYEVCPHCDNENGYTFEEVDLVNGICKCKDCGHMILLCSMCTMANCRGCTLENSHFKLYI